MPNNGVSQSKAWVGGRVRGRAGLRSSRPLADSPTRPLLPPSGACLLAATLLLPGSTSWLALIPAPAALLPTRPPALVLEQSEVDLPLLDVHPGYFNLHAITQAEPPPGPFSH